MYLIEIIYLLIYFKIKSYFFFLKLNPKVNLVLFTRIVFQNLN